MTSRLYGADFDPAIRLIWEGRVRVKDIITNRVCLEEAPGLILNVLGGRKLPIKVMISA